MMCSQLQESVTYRTHVIPFKHFFCDYARNICFDFFRSM